MPPAVFGLTPIEVSRFSGLNTLIPATQLPPYCSPATQDVQFVPGRVLTRPGTSMHLEVSGDEIPGSLIVTSNTKTDINVSTATIPIPTSIEVGDIIYVAARYKGTDVLSQFNGTTFNKGLANYVDTAANLNSPTNTYGLQFNSWVATSAGTGGEFTFNFAATMDEVEMVLAVVRGLEQSNSFYRYNWDGFSTVQTPGDTPVIEQPSFIIAFASTANTLTKQDSSFELIAQEGGTALAWKRITVVADYPFDVWTHVGDALGQNVSIPIRTEPSPIPATLGSFNYLKPYIQPNLHNILLAFDSAGVLWGEIFSGTLTNISNPYFISHPSYMNSATQFGREYIGVGDGTFGIDVPRQYDGANFDRISQEGPGAAPTVADGGAGNISAGDHKLVVMFVTRQGFVTRPSPYVVWTAAGSMVADITNIPIGPPNVVARILAFTGTAGSSFYYTAGTSGLPNMVIADNTTTAITMDFTDTQLLSGTNVDSYFRLVELGEVSGVATYANRMFYTGERNKINNLFNVAFDGGFQQVGSPAENTRNASSGVNDSGNPSSLPWTNPNNVTSPTSYASLTLTAGQTFGFLFARVAGYTLAATDIVTGVSFTFDIKTENFQAEDILVVWLNTTDAVYPTYKTVVQGENQERTVTLGGPNDLWDYSSLLYTDINSPTVGLGFEFAQFSGNDHSATASVRNVMMTVHLQSGGSINVYPLGWTPDGTFGDGTGKLVSDIWGHSLTITGDGATATRGLITQSAYQDQDGVPIISPATSYSVRARVKKFGTLTAGILHIDLQSTTDSIDTTGIQVTFAQATTEWQEFIAVLTDPLNSVPSDLRLRVFANGTPSNGAGFVIENIEVFPTAQPYNATLAKVSFADDPESIDGISGLISVAPENGQAIRTAFVIRDFLYFVKERSLYVTSDQSEQEPSQWTVREVSSTVGTQSVRGVGIGDEWAIIAGLSGVYFFDGGNPQPLSDEIRPTWDRINWDQGELLEVKIDTRIKRIYIAAPLDDSESNNVKFVLDYTEGFGDPLASKGAGRKWNIWHIPSASMTMAEVDNNHKLLIGNGVGNGKIYLLDDGALNDDGVAIDSYWQSGYASSATRALIGYVSANITGAGVVDLAAYYGDQNKVKTLRGWTLSEYADHNHERQVQVIRERLAVRVGTDTLNHHFSLQGLFLWIRQASTQLIRGRN